MIHISVKVNCTACSALERPPVVYYALGYVPVTWRFEKTQAELRRFPLAFCATAAVHRAACWQWQQQPVLWVNRRALHLETALMGSGSNSDLDHKWTCLVWPSKQFCKTAKQLVTIGSLAKKETRPRVIKGCWKLRLKYPIRQQSQVAKLSNFHILTANFVCFAGYSLIFCTFGNCFVPNSGLKGIIIVCDIE